MTCVRRQTVRNRAPRRPGPRGFTLIEVLMAAFVMAIGVLGLTALFAGAARQQQLSSQSTRSVAHARSADAYISKRFGPIEAVDGTTGKLVPPVQNNQQPFNEVRPDQWYVIPRTADGSISINPTEAKDGWKNTSLYTRSEPREVLPRLMYRARFERADGQFVETGRPGGDKQNKVSNLSDFADGAPDFDGEIRELRVIADSIKLRVVTRAFPCAGSTVSADERSLTAPDDREIVLTWDENVADTLADVITLTSPDGSEAQVRTAAKSKDADLNSTNGQTRLTYAYIADVVNATLPDSTCGTQAKHWVQYDPSNPSECDAGAVPKYLFDNSANGTGELEEVTNTPGRPGYDIRLGTDKGKRYLYALLRASDRCAFSAQMYKEGPGGFVLSDDPVTPPAAYPLAVPVSGVALRPAQIPDRFIHEIWLEDYRYRAHTLVSLPESVTYAQSTEDQGLRVPQLGYSMLFRRTSDASVQYALFSYAISPTYPPTADKSDNTEDDYFPREDAQAITGEQVAPIQLVQNLTLEFDQDLGLYYVKILTESKIKSIGWVASPGQILLFNGDASANPPIPGADAPVRVVNTRKLGANELRAYLDGPPRAGLRALSDFGSDKTFDAWVIAPKCEVTQRKTSKSAPIYYWGLKPVEARIFTVGQ